VNRRAFVALSVGGVLAVPVMAGAQSAGKVYRIGVVSAGTSWVEGSQFLEALRQGLRSVGYVEGQNLILERRNAEGQYDRLPGFIADLVRLKVDLIYGLGPPGVQAALLAGTAIPLVVVDLESDPIERGFVASLSRPGGHITGLFLDMPEITGKWLELLKGAAPKLARVAVLWDSTTGTAQVKATEAGARALALQIQIFAVEGRDTFGAVLETVRNTRPGGLVVLSSPFLLQQRQRCAHFARENRLPAISMFREFAEEGGLMAYGPNYTDMTRRGALAIDRILKGAKPGDLPIERPEKFDFVINLKTAKALGLTIPQSLLMRADQVLE
jgi:putative tryptophan/tyrosine transport system substrate-binding protein